MIEIKKIRNVYGKIEMEMFEDTAYAISSATKMATVPKKKQNKSIMTLANPNGMHAPWMFFLQKSLWL